jgi:COMPASS component SWD1
VPDDEKTKRKQVDEDISVDVTACDSIQAFLDSDEEEDKEEVFYLPSLPFEEDGQKSTHMSSDEEYTKKSVIKRKLLKKKKKSAENIDERPKKVLKK